MVSQICGFDSWSRCNISHFQHTHDTTNDTIIVRVLQWHEIRTQTSDWSLFRFPDVMGVLQGSKVGDAYFCHSMASVLIIRLSRLPDAINLPTMIPTDFPCWLHSAAAQECHATGATTVYISICGNSISDRIFNYVRLLSYYWKMRKRNCFCFICPNKLTYLCWHQCQNNDD